MEDLFGGGLTERGCVESHSIFSVLCVEFSNGILLLRVEIQLFHGHLKDQRLGWECGEVIGRVPYQDRLPEIYVTEVGITRASGSTGTCSGTGLLRCGWQNLPRLVDNLVGAVTWTRDGLK